MDEEFSDFTPVETDTGSIEEIVSFSKEADKLCKLVEPDKKEEKTTYMKDGRPITYNDQTENYYRVMRLTRQDPITTEKVSKSTGFQFKYEWDPYTGERKGEDPHGALWFDPDMLIKQFYSRRLTKLWIEPSDEDSGYYSGTPAEGVGAGEDFFFSHKHHPEWYLFRLPVVDCYLTKDHQMQVITMGPKLTDEEIKEIDRRAEQQGNSYRDNFGRRSPSLLQIIKLYDMAIDQDPKIEGSDKMSDTELRDAKTQYNIKAVEALRAIRG